MNRLSFSSKVHKQEKISNIYFLQYDFIIFLSVCTNEYMYHPGVQEGYKTDYSKKELENR